MTDWREDTPYDREEMPDYKEEERPQKIMKAVIVLLNGKWMWITQSDDEILLQRKKNTHQHLKAKIVSWDEWELIERCQ